MSIAGLNDDEWPTSGKLTEAEVNARAAVEWENNHVAAFFAAKSFDACKSGPCDGGKKLCHTPDACQRAAQDFCGYSWWDRFADRFFSHPLIDKAGGGTGMFLIAASAVGVISAIAVVWP